MTHPVITNCVNRGFLEPIRALDENGHDVTVYVPTRHGQRWFGPQFSTRENVVDLRKWQGES